MTEKVPTQKAPLPEAGKGASNKAFIKLCAAVKALLSTAATAKNGAAPKCCSAAGKRFSGAEGQQLSASSLYFRLYNIKCCLNHGSEKYFFDNNQL